MAFAAELAETPPEHFLGVARSLSGRRWRARPADEGEARAIGLRHGLGLVAGTVQAGIDAGLIAPQPATVLAHVLIGALDESALYVARAEDPEAARAEVVGVLDRMIDGLAP